MVATGGKGDGPFVSLWLSSAMMKNCKSKPVNYWGIE